MKRLLLCLSLLSTSLSAFAAHWLTYFVYAETEYLQGPWIRAEELGAFSHKYLQAEAFEDLFGTEPLQLADQLLKRLKEKKPEVYNFSYDLDVQEGTVVLKPTGPVADLSTIQNEVTATLLFNGFRAVNFELDQQQQIWTLQDLTLPYFDIQFTTTKPEIDTAASRQFQEPAPQVQVSSPEQKQETNWLLFSVILNLVLILFWLLYLVRNKGLR